MKLNQKKCLICEQKFNLVGNYKKYQKGPMTKTNLLFLQKEWILIEIFHFNYWIIKPHDVESILIIIFLFQPQDASSLNPGMESISTLGSALLWVLLITLSVRRVNVLKTLEVTLWWRIQSMERSAGDAWLYTGNIRMFFLIKRVSQHCR